MPDDETTGTLKGTGGEAAEYPLLEAAGAVHKHREAIQRGDVRTVGRTMDLFAHGAGEQGLLGKLAASQSIEAAVETLRPFFRQATFSIEHARQVTRDEVEIYERVLHPSFPAPLRTLSLVRRRGGYWRVVTTSNAPDERFVARIFCGQRGAEPVAFNAAAWSALWKAEHGGTTTLTLEDDRGRLADADRGFEARVRRAAAEEANVEDGTEEVRALADASSTVIAFALVPPTEGIPRLLCLAWFSAVLAHVADRLRADGVHLPVCGRVTTARALANADFQDLLAPTLLAKVWADVDEVDGWLGTRGMTHFMLPEVEVERADFAHAIAARQVVDAASEQLLVQPVPIKPGDEVSLAGHMIRAEPGRRGPVAGGTFGRWGSLILRPM